jgi:small-conductance mechanosensitive channel
LHALENITASYNSGMQKFELMWQQAYFDNSLRDWVIAGVAFLAVLTLLPLLRSYLLAQQRRLPPGMPGGVTLALRLLERTRRVFLWALALYVAERFLALPPLLERASRVLVVLIAWGQVALWGSAAVRFALERRRDAAAAARGERALPVDVGGSFDILLFIARIVIFTVALLLALDNLGVNITALIAGIGVGGIAIALAVQTVLGDILASLSITLDQPFVLGDWLRIDDCEGIVEHIGIKSTRLRSLSGEQIILANADVLKSRVRNFGRMPERRALFVLGVVYETPQNLLDQLPLLVEQAVTATSGTRFEYCLLRSFGDSALNFEVCYFVPEPTGRRYLEILDQVNRAILAAFNREGIRFAYPTRTVMNSGVAN